MDFDEFELNCLRPKEMEHECEQFQAFSVDAVPPTSQDPEVWKAFFASQNAIAMRNNQALKAAIGIRATLKDILSRAYSKAGADGKLLAKKNQNERCHQRDLRLNGYAS